MMKIITFLLKKPQTITETSECSFWLFKHIMEILLSSMLFTNMQLIGTTYKKVSYQVSSACH